MPKKSITIGGIFSLIGVIALYLLLIQIVADPLNNENAEKVALETIDQATPPQTNIIVALAPYGIIGVILMFIILYFWKKIMSYKIPISY